MKIKRRLLGGGDPAAIAAIGFVGLATLGVIGMASADHEAEVGAAVSATSKITAAINKSYANFKERVAKEKKWPLNNETDICNATQSWSKNILDQYPLAVSKNFISALMHFKTILICMARKKYAFVLKTETGNNPFVSPYQMYNMVISWECDEMFRDTSLLKKQLDQNASENIILITEHLNDLNDALENEMFEANRSSAADALTAAAKDVPFLEGLEIADGAKYLIDIDTKFTDEFIEDFTGFGDELNKMYQKVFQHIAGLKSKPGYRQQRLQKLFSSFRTILSQCTHIESAKEALLKTKLIPSL